MLPNNQITDEDEQAKPSQMTKKLKEEKQKFLKAIKSHKHGVDEVDDEEVEEAINEKGDFETIQLPVKRKAEVESDQKKGKKSKRAKNK